MRSIPYAGEAGGYVTLRMCGPAQPLKRTPIGRGLDLIWEASMHRFFFDLIGIDLRSLDFHGRMVSSMEEARDIAELLALGLGCSETDDWDGSEIQVCDEAGRKLFVTPIYRLYC